MDKMHIAVTEDSKQMAEEVIKTLQGISDRQGWKCEIHWYSSGNEFVNAIKKQKIDIVFLDIEMPEGDGFYVAEAIRAGKQNIYIIFLTNMQHLVYSSLKFQPFRFVRKSVWKEEIEEAFVSAGELIEGRYKKCGFLLKKKMSINISDIIYIHTGNHNLEIVCSDGMQFPVRETIKEAEKELGQYGFIRPHMGYLVNPQYIYSVGEDSLILDNKMKIPVSRNRREEVRKKYFEEYMARIGG